VRHLAGQVPQLEASILVDERVEIRARRALYRSFGGTPELSSALRG
jgi:hypothetical protein